MDYSGMVALAVAAMVGFAAGWFWMASRSQQASTQLIAQKAALEVQLQAEKTLSQSRDEQRQQDFDLLKAQFQNLATEILEEKARRFTEQNQQNLKTLLEPFGQRLSEFGRKVDDVHRHDIAQQAALKTELQHLKDINLKMSQEANDLTTALKGKAKVQGNWGELVLSNVLESSGLREGHDYRREVSFNTDEGRRRPDVVVNLPQDKHLVIDAKVSLNAYTRYIQSEEEGERAQALKEHVAAMADRIDELADRNYFQLPGLNTPEMVFMFVPIESAFVEAMRADASLFQRAVSRNILVATPTTLLTSLNIVRQLWRFEEQNRNTAELADRASKIHQKLVGFVTSLREVGSKLEGAQDSWGKAMNQLSEGRGNLIVQAKEFERLGVSVKSDFPPELVERASLELEPPKGSGE
jgi:DNA recombination protein RmuC